MHCTVRWLMFLAYFLSELTNIMLAAASVQLHVCVYSDANNFTKNERQLKLERKIHLSTCLPASCTAPACGLIIFSPA